MSKMLTITMRYMTKKISFLLAAFLVAASFSFGQKLQLNDSDYFEKPVVNVFVFSGQYSPGAVRLQNTPEQWDLIPVMSDRKIDRANNSIVATMTYKEFDFALKTVVTAADRGVEISVYLDKPLPKELEGHAGFNMEFLAAVYFEKSFLADGKPGYFPLYPTSNTQVVPVSKKIRQYGTYATFDDRGTGQFITASQRINYCNS